MTESESTSYGYASWLRSDENLPTLLHFLAVAKSFLDESEAGSCSKAPGHLKAFQDDIEDLRAYGAGLCEDILHQAKTHGDTAETATKLLETAEQMRSLMMKHEVFVEEMHEEAVGVMSHEEEELLRRCFRIYSEDMAASSDAWMSREELEEAIVSCWKRESTFRCKLLPGPSLSDDFMCHCMALGFTSEKLPAPGRWEYALICGSTLPNMWRRCCFLQQHQSEGVQQVFILAAERPVDQVDMVDAPIHSNACTKARTEADLACILLEYLRSGGKLWSEAQVVRGDAKGGFLGGLDAWLCTSRQPGSVLVVSHQPHLRRMELQLLRRLQVTQFKAQRVQVVGEGFNADYGADYAARKSSILLDAIAHWVQIQREEA